MPDAITPAENASETRFSQLVGAIEQGGVTVLEDLFGEAQRPDLIMLEDGRCLLVFPGHYACRELDHLWPGIDGRYREEPKGARFHVDTGDLPVYGKAELLKITLEEDKEDLEGWIAEMESRVQTEDLSEADVKRLNAWRKTYARVTATLASM